MWRMGIGRQLARIAATATRDGPAPLLLARRAIREYSAIQRTWELQALIGQVRRVRPRVLVEIGTHLGGTLVCWFAVADPAAHLVSIDLPAPGADTRDETLARAVRQRRPSQRLTTITGDSHAPETLARLREALQGAAVDVLWIDGDHSYAGTRQDFEMYAPLVRAGGLVAFHDIHGSRMFPGSQSHVFWAEITPRHRTREFIADPRPGEGMGVGIVFLP